jgi:predicted transcriptional regulator
VTLHDVKNILDAEVVAGEHLLDKEVRVGACADLMSDILAFAASRSLLLTGLTNPQIVRTSDVLDICAIVVVRGKKPPPETVDLARQLDIPLLLTKFILYEAVGRLYANGIVGCIRKAGEKRDLS